MPDIQPADTAKVPSLDEVRDELRDELLLQSARLKSFELFEEATGVLVEKVQLSATLPPEDPDAITPEQAAEIARAYAEENGLLYTETPMLSVDEMFADEEYAITAASDLQTRRAAPIAALQADGNFEIEQAISPSRTLLLYWRTATEAPHEPTGLDEPGVREQVAAEWKRQQAMPLAEARATELADAARKAEGEEPLAQVATDEPVVAGDDDSGTLQLTEASDVTYLSAPVVPGPNGMQSQMPQPTNIGQRLGARTPLGDEFLQTVFEKLQPGEVGVTYDDEKKSFWVVQVEPTEPVKPSDGFDKAPVFGSRFSSPYPDMAVQYKLRTGGNWRQSLLNEYGVE